MILPALCLSPKFSWVENPTCHLLVAPPECLVAVGSFIFTKNGNIQHSNVWSRIPKEIILAVRDPAIPTPSQ